MNKFLKKHQFHLFSILVIFALFLLYNWTLVTNLSTALNDWYDYPLMVYIMQQNISHISSLDFVNFGNFSIFHPSPGGMYFTDLLLPQSIFGLALYPLIQNYITTHNVVFLIVGLLNIISLQYFWQIIFKDKRIVSILTLLFTFSPYSLNMYAHYQMISYWFFFFSLGRLLTAKTFKDYAMSGIFSGLQFLAAVYLGIYSITISAIFFLWKFISKEKLLTLTKQGFIFLFGFIVIAGYFVFQFAQVKNVYQIQRSADEYINHSMQISDFLFNPLPSLWTETVYKNINAYNKRLGGETFGTGFILLATSIFGAIVLKKSKINKKEKFLFGFVLLMSLWGLIAVFGPRLSINGKYLAIPLPYIFALKLTPFFDALRVVSRWFFIVQIGLLFLTGFSIKYVIKHYSHKTALLIISIILLFYAIEIIPIRQRTTVDTYRNYSYDKLIKNCKSNHVILEYPFVPQQPETHILITLNYWVKMLLNTMHYDCQLVNGYSGYQPKHIDDFIHNFRLAIENQDPEQINKLLEQKEVTYLKFNKAMMIPKSIKQIELLFMINSFKILVSDDDYFIVQVKQ